MKKNTFRRGNVEFFKYILIKHREHNHFLQTLNVFFQSEEILKEIKLDHGSCKKKNLQNLKLLTLRLPGI